MKIKRQKKMKANENILEGHSGVRERPTCAGSGGNIRCALRTGTAAEAGTGGGPGAEREAGAKQKL